MKTLMTLLCTSWIVFLCSLTPNNVCDRYDMIGMQYNNNLLIILCTTQLRVMLTINENMMNYFYKCQKMIISTLYKNIDMSDNTCKAWQSFNILDISLREKEKCSTGNMFDQTKSRTRTFFLNPIQLFTFFETPYTICCILICYLLIICDKTPLYC